MSFFFFKQKKAYAMRISDWSSDVCSSDLLSDHVRGRLDKWRPGNLPAILPLRSGRFLLLMDIKGGDALVQLPHAQEAVWAPLSDQIGRASCRERVCQYV